jgi:hypothetical protein
LSWTRYRDKPEFFCYSLIICFPLTIILAPLYLNEMERPFCFLLVAAVAVLKSFPQTYMETAGASHLYHKQNNLI